MIRETGAAGTLGSMARARARWWLALLATSACGRIDELRSRFVDDEPVAGTPATGTPAPDRSASGAAHSASPDETIVQVAAGWDHACLRTEAGEVWCWGELTYEAAHAKPERLDFGGPVAFIAAGSSSYTCAARQDGTVACRDDEGLQSIAGITDARAVAVVDSGPQGCAVRAGGGVVCWSGPRATPVHGLDDAVALAGGQGFCALREGGALACWGSGLAPFGLPRSDTPVDTPASDLSAVAAGSWHVCGAKTTGEVVCVGENAAGQLGDGKTANSSTGVRPTGLTNVRSLSARYTRTIAVDAAGHVHWWGDPAAEAHVDGPRAATTPEEIGGLEHVVEATTGIRFACARTKAGVVSCWGHGKLGQLGDGTTSDRSEPAPIVWPVEVRKTTVSPRAPSTDTGVTVGKLTITTPHAGGSSDHAMSVSLPITYASDRAELVAIVARCEVDDDVLVSSVNALKPFGFAPGAAFDRNDLLLFDHRELPRAPARCEIHVGLSNDDMTTRGPEIGTVCWDGKTSPWAACEPELQAATPGAGDRPPIEVRKLQPSEASMEGTSWSIDLDIVARLAKVPAAGARLTVRSSCVTHDGARREGRADARLAVPFGVRAGDGVARRLELHEDDPLPGEPRRCGLSFFVHDGEPLGPPVATLCWMGDETKAGACD